MSFYQVLESVIGEEVFTINIDFESFIMVINYDDREYEGLDFNDYDVYVEVNLPKLRDNLEKFLKVIDKGDEVVPLQKLLEKDDARLRNSFEWKFNELLVARLPAGYTFEIEIYREIGGGNVYDVRVCLECLEREDMEDMLRIFKERL